MASNSIALVAGGLVVVVLSLGAGLLGGSLATPPDGGGPIVDSGTSDAGTRARMDEFDRQIGNIEERMRVAEDTANAALQRAAQIDALRRDVEALKGAAATGTDVVMPSGAGPIVEEPRELTPEERVQLDKQHTADLRASMRKIAGRNGPVLLKTRLATIASAGEQGDADRRTQINADAKMMATQLGLSAAEEETVHDILHEEMASSVREIAPFLAAGIEKADYSQVKPKLTAIWDKRDARMSEVLDKDQLKDYLDNQKEWRTIFDSALDNMERARLDPK